MFSRSTDLRGKIVANGYAMRWRALESQKYQNTQNKNRMTDLQNSTKPPLAYRESRAQFLVYQDEFVELYNCDSKLFENDNRTVDLVFADPPYGMNLDKFENILMRKCSGHTFLMTNERILIPFSNKYLDNFARMYAVNTVVPNLVSNKAPMTQVDFISEFRFGKTRFVNNKQCFSTLIEAKKLRMMKQYSQNFDKQKSLFAFFFNHFTKEGDLILDPFCGSGSSLLAARQLKRKIIGFEINSKSCQYAKDKLSQLELF